MIDKWVTFYDGTILVNIIPDHLLEIFDLLVHLRKSITRLKYEIGIYHISSN